MKLRLPNKLIAAIMAAASPALFQTLSTATIGAAAAAVMAGHTAMAEAVEVTYTSQTTGVTTNNATVNKSGSEAEDTGAESYTGTIQLGDFTSTDLTSITISGNNGGTISNSNTNGGYGGRITTNGASSTITQFTFNKGIEVTLKNGTNATGKTLVFDNASFWGEGNANYAANLLINEGGARMNGNTGNNYTVSGSISGVGDLYIVSGNANATQVFTGSLAGFSGAIYGQAGAGAQRKMTFGNGGAATNIGGSIGKSNAVFREVVFNSVGNQTVAGNVYATTLTTQNLTSLAVGGALQTTTLNLGNTVLSVGGTASVNGELTSSATTGAFTGTGSLALGDNFSVAGLTTGDNYSTGVLNKGFEIGGEQFALVTEAGRSSLDVTLGSALTNDGWSYNAENGMLSHAQQTRSVYHVGNGITVSRGDTDAEAQRMGLDAYTVQVDNGGKMTFAQHNPASATTYSLNNILSGVSSAGTLEIDYGSNATLTWDKTSDLAGSVVLKSGNLVKSSDKTQVSSDLTIVLDGADALFSADRSLRTNLEVRKGSVFSAGNTDVIDYDNTDTARTLVLDGGTLNVGNYRQTVRGYTFTLRNGGKIAGAGAYYSGGSYTAALDVISNTTINVFGSGNVIEGNVAGRDNNTITIATANAGDELTLNGLVVSNNGGGIAKTGNGTLVLSGTEGGVATHTGKFALQGGTLAITGGQTVKMTKSLSFANAANISIGAGNTLDLTGLSTAITAANYLDFVSNKRFVGEGTVKMNGNTSNNTTPGMEVMLANNTATDKAILTHYDITGAITFNGSGQSNEQNGKAVLTVGNGAIAAGLKTSQDMRLGNYAHLKVSENASLEVGGRLWLGHNQDAGSYPGLLTINGGDVTLGSVGIKASTSANKFIMNSGSLEFTTAGNIVKGYTSQGGDPDLNTSSTLFELNSGTLKANSASWTLNHKATIGAVTVETDADHTIGITGNDNTYQGTITNKGNLSLAGSGSVNIADISNFEVAGERVATDFDGEGTYAGSGHLVGTDTQYYLVKDGSGSSLEVGEFTLTGGSRVGAGNNYIFTFANDSTLPTDTYFINSNLTYNSTEMDDAKISVSHGATLTVDSAVANTTTNIVNHGTVLLNGANATNNGAALLKVTDNGGVVVGKSTTIDGGVVTQATGNLTINNGALLSVGSGEAQTNSLSSFSSLTLDNGSIKYQNKMDDLHNVTVASGTTGKIASKDMSAPGSAALRLLGTTRVDGTLTMNNYWNAQFEIEHLIGSGELKLTGMSGTDNLNDSTESNEAASYTISSLSGFTGTLTFNNKKASAAINTGAAGAELAALSVTNSTTGDTSNGIVFNAQGATQIGTITVGESGKLTFDGNSKLTTQHVIRNEGKLIVNTDIDAAGISIRSGEVQLNHDGSVGEISTIEAADFNRKLVVGSDAIVTATMFNNSWGMAALQVDGELSISGALNLASGGQHSADTTPNKVTGSGTISAGSLAVGNWGTYNIDVNELNVSGNFTAEGQGDYYPSHTNFNGGSTVVAGNATINANADINVGGGTGAALLEVQGTTTIGGTAVNIKNQGTLNLAGAEITKKSGSSDAAVKYVTVDAAGMTGSDSTPAATANISNATITIDSLLTLADETAYRISDMSFAGTDVIYYHKLDVSDVVVDGTSSVRAADGVTDSTLSGQNYLTLSDASTVIKPNTNISTDQLSGLTLQSADGNSLSLTLNNPVSDTLTNGAGFSITLSDFKWQDLIGEGGTVQEFAIIDQGRLNEVFKVTALGSGAPTSIRVVNAQMINGGQDLLLDVVPEPTTGALSLLALTALAARRRRR